MFELGFEEATAWAAIVFEEDEGFIAEPLTELGEEAAFTELIGDAETSNDADFVPDDGLPVVCVTFANVEESAFMLCFLESEGDVGLFDKTPGLGDDADDAGSKDDLGG
jgi:hypothetical protein